MSIESKLDPYDAHCQLAVALLQQSRFEEALTELRRAIALQPSRGDACNELGIVLREMARVPEAIATFRNAVALTPNDPGIRWNLAVALLLNGEFREGWQLVEARWQLPQVAMHREIKGPAWDGGSLGGRTILLHSEQGFGDTLQFIRYAPMVRTRGGNVIVYCQEPLQRLLQAQPGIGRVVSGDIALKFDTHCPLMSLPRLMNTTLETIPSARSYLSADGSLSKMWRGRLNLLPPSLKVGLCWSGRPDHARDHVRSVRWEELAPLSSQQNVTFVSLQKPPTSTQPLLEMNFVDWTDELNDFADTAALISQLDLIISVDTAVAHLSGALGKPVWLLTSFSPDWRWLMGRTDSPWYPTMRLFRQATLNDWRSPVGQITGELSLVAGRFDPRNE